MVGYEPGGAFEQPPLSSNEDPDSGLVPGNIRAVAMIYAAWQLEELGLFEVVDRIVTSFMSGQRPIGFDQSGQASAAYAWFRSPPPSVTAHRLAYARVLGVPAAVVVADQPLNAQFASLFRRFLLALLEYDAARGEDEAINADARASSAAVAAVPSGRRAATLPSTAHRSAVAIRMSWRTS